MFTSLREKLARTRKAFRKVEDLFQSGKRREEILDGLEEALILADVGRPPAASRALLLMAGVKGGGKTASAAKLAARFKREGRRVVLAAADTFRAAAQEQLALRGKKTARPGARAA